MTGGPSGWGLTASVTVIAAAATAGAWLATHPGSAPAVPNRIVVEPAATAAAKPPPGGHPSRGNHPKPGRSQPPPAPATTPAPVVVTPSLPVVTEPPDDHSGSGRGGDA